MKHQKRNEKEDKVVFFLTADTLFTKNNLLSKTTCLMTKIAFSLG